MDLLEFNGKLNYANIPWRPVQIVNRIICGLVGRWMNNSEKVAVIATDSLSVNKKKEEYDQMSFYVHNKEQLKELEKESGIQIMPKGENIPEDEDDLKLWVTQMQKLPEEIKYETGVNDVLDSNGFYDVNKEKLLHDSAEVGFVGTYTYMDKEGVVRVEWVKPENAIYSYSNYPDFRDTTWRGHMTSYKISEIRKKYGKEFGGELTEEQLFQIAQISKEYQLYDKITWMYEWNVAFLRPYDEWNVDVMEFELKTVDSEGYTITETKQNKSTIINKGKPNKIKDNQKYVEDTNWNIYRGVYIPTANIMLEWGIKKNMIRPQDPKEIGNAEFSYSFYMYQNYDMKNLAVPEKIELPVDGMIITVLKMMQLIAKMRPTGAAINWDALQNIDYGVGDKNKEIDVKRLYDQTGDIYYRGRDAEGNQVPVPIQELQNTGFLGQMQGLVQLYNFHYQVLKDELGEDPNFVGQALQPRVASSNVDAAMDSQNNATRYMYDAYLLVMADTAKKISCLLKNSVEYGSNAYRALINEEDVRGKIFSTKLKMLPTATDIAKFEALMNQGMASNPDLILYINPFQLMRLAKEDVLLAETLFRRGQKRMLIDRQNATAANQEATFKAQQESAMQKGQMDNQNIQTELAMKAQISDTESKNRMKEIILKGTFDIMAKGMEVNPEWKPVIDELIHNVGLPLFAENMSNMQQASAQPQGAEEEATEGQQPMQEEQGEQGGEEMQQQGQEPQESQEQGMEESQPMGATQPEM